MNIHQDSTASLPNNCVWSGYISVEYSTWPIYYLHGRFQVWSLNPTATPNSCLHQIFKTWPTHLSFLMINHFAEQPPTLNVTITKNYCSTSVEHWKFHVIVSKSASNRSLIVYFNFVLIFFLKKNCLNLGIKWFIHES